jgi:Holliday junction resolvase-like predicted endonuclease
VGLRWKDFEQLVEHILDRTGWKRISTLGGNREGIDIEVENLTAEEIAFVQVKSRATQAVLDEYVRRSMSTLGDLTRGGIVMRE